MIEKKGVSIKCGAFRLYRDGKSPYWQVRASHPKRKPLFESTKEIDQKKAEVKAKAIYALWLEKKKLIPGEKIIFEDLWNEYLPHKRETVSHYTYSRIFQIGEQHLLPYFAYKLLDEIPILWPRWLAAQRKERPASTFFNERKYLVGAYRYAYEHEYVPRVPRFTVPVKAKTPGKVFTDDEIKKLIKACEGRRSLLLQVLMGLTMGMRHGEIANLELHRVDLENRTIHLGERDTKTKRARTIRISDAVYPLLKEKVEIQKAFTPWLFPQKRDPLSVEKMQSRDARWSDLKRKAGVKGRFHDLRHTCATRLAKSGVSAEVACAYLGMSLKVYDETYCHLNVEDTAAAANIVELPKQVEIVGGEAVET